jgi:hypothetical protein
MCLSMPTKSTPRKPAEPAPRTTEGQEGVRISVLLTKEQRQRLKVLAASRGLTISEVVRQGIERFLGSDA